MLLSMYAEFVLVASSAILVLEVNSQGIRFDFEEERPAKFNPSPVSCDYNSYCVPLQRCEPLRVLHNWKTAGVTCGYGQGAFRRVCCPIIIERSGGVNSQNTGGSNNPTRRPGSRKLPIYPISPRVNIDGCGTVRSALAKQIINGRNATEGAWPWMVAITMRENSGIYTPWCTGFLIDRRHVLSAAHCFDRRDASLYRTRIGRVNQNEGDMYRVIRIAVPPGYRKGIFYDDIAILTLAREVKTPGYNAICLPDDELSRKDLEGHGTSVAGWGRTSTRNGNLSIILQQLRGMPVVSNQECNRIYRNTLLSNFPLQFPRGVNSAFICAGFPEGMKDACGGDSGGPLMYRHRNKWFAVGIVSFGYKCGRKGIPGGYTRISQYLEWIAINTSD